MVTFYDELTDELQRACIRIKDELIFSPQKYGEKFYFHIEIPSESKFFRISYEEYVFVSLLDGKTSFAHALAASAQALGPDALSADKGEKLVAWLLENGLAVFADAKRQVSSRTSDSKNKPWYQKANPFWLKFPLGDPNALLNMLRRPMAWLFHPLFLCSSLILILTSMFLGAANFEAMYASSTSIFAYKSWVGMLVIWAVLKIIHELAHGLACRHYGGEVRETGVIFILFAPLAYVDVTSSWRFKSKWQRMMVAAAGMYVELLIAAVCILLWFVTSSALLKQQLMNVVTMAGISTILFNANPLMRFDGYFILSDLLGIPNLYASGTAAFRQHMRWLFFGQVPKDSCVEMSNKKWLVASYGYLAVSWKVVICLGLAIAASVMFEGLGILLACLGIVSWFGKPVLQLGKEIVYRLSSQPHSLLRAGIVVSTLIALLTLSWTTIPNPFATRCPCIVDFEDAAKIRTQSAGFVAEVLVTDGEWVTKGTPLFELKNDELEVEVLTCRAELEQHLTRERFALDQQDAAEAQNAAQDYQATKQMLQKREKELAELIVRAPVAGQVFASRNLAELKGQFVKEGDHILTIGDDSTKEILLSISSDQVSPAALVGTRIPIEIGTRRRIMATIERIDPRASVQVAEPKLIAPNGGPLAVKMDGSEEQIQKDQKYTLCQPRFQAIAAMDTKKAGILMAGEIGHAVLSPASHTLGQQAYISTRDWLRKQLQFANASSNQGSAGSPQN